MTQSIEERRADRRKYYVEHKEEAATSNKKWCETHKEQMVATRKRYYAEHKEEAATSNKKWRETHKEQVVATRKRYYAEHKEKCKSNTKRWYETHKKQMISDQNTERLLKLNHSVENLNPCYILEAKAILAGKNWKGKNKCTKLPGDEQ